MSDSFGFNLIFKTKKWGRVGVSVPQVAVALRQAHFFIQQALLLRNEYPEYEEKWEVGQKWCKKVWINSQFHFCKSDHQGW